MARFAHYYLIRPQVNLGVDSRKVSLASSQDSDTNTLQLKQAALEVSTGSASPVRPWAERRGRPATTSDVQIAGSSHLIVALHAKAAYGRGVLVLAGVRVRTLR